MSDKIKTLSLILFLGAVFLQVQPSLSVALDQATDQKKEKGHIAVAALGDGPESEISSNAGRAPYYLIFNDKGVLLKSIENPALDRRGGASRVVLELLLKESCTTVIAGNFGDRMEAQLRANDIEYYKRDGIVKEVLKAFVNQ